MLNWLYNTFWATLIRKVCTVLVVLAVVVSLAVIIPGRIGAPEYCAEGVERSAGECIGVSASGYDFGTDGIREVTRAIGEENKRISEQEREGNLVTVAMMLPLQPKADAERKQLRSELQGAYLAQWRANRTENKPLLRLVLANPGADYAQQEKVVDRLAAMADSPRDNLRAVTGFNLSLDNTKRAIDRLTNKLHIPVLASRVSADEIANTDNGGALKYAGLARIIPTNRQQAAALANFHGGLRDADTVLVKDLRPNDIYDESLAKAFSRPEPGPPGPKDQPFTSPGINDPGDTGNDFTFIGHNICESDAKVVYFAGRPVHLRLFALKLSEVPCHGKKYTVVSGSGAATLDRYMSAADWEKLRGDDGGGSTITVQYAAPGHPDAWDASLRTWEKEQRARTGKSPAVRDRPVYLTEPQDELRELRRLIDREAAGDIGPVSLEDSRTMLVHDGVRTIAAAVFLANSQAAGTVPTRTRVAAQWPRLEARYRVRGTSGWICLTNGGNAYDKPVAVVQLDPATRRVAFVGLGWPEKKPQPADCVVPSGTG
ncbi:ABC transporter substrate-binding protein [Streptomyces rimosus]|uniref:ABC transporter substrate-binding protein n=1 Tax=Streptomyces rimosus TaxID=1927 RepID=UPI0004C534F0|nr:ABC transporter substrate-binding protein [Streptomyces rimosus]